MPLASSIEPSGVSLLFRLIDALLKLHGHDNTPVDVVLAQLQFYGSHYTDWRKFALFAPSHYTRNLVETSDTVEFIVLCWGPGQEARIHDHGGSHCFMLALQGELVETRYAKVVDGKETSESDTPTEAPGACPELRAIGSSTITVGGPAAYISDKLALHKVSNLTSEPAISLHVYSPPIRRVKIFESDTHNVANRTPGFFSVLGHKTGKD